MTAKRLAAILLIGAIAIAALACDDDGDASEDGEVTSPTSERAAERPEWFPDSFPLPADTVVASETPDDAGGGTVQFSSPVSFERALEILDLNLSSHGYTVSNENRGEEEATFDIESRTFTGNVIVRPENGGSMLEVTLQPNEQQ